MNIKTIIKSLLTVLLIISVNLKYGVAQPADCISDIYTAEINETSLHYIECGEGDPVVLVHGSLGDYRSWVGQIKPLSQNYKVISYSRRYHYPSPWPKDASDFTVNIHAEDLAAFIQSLDLGKVHLIGHSYGGFTSLLVARDHPELIRSLTLGEPPAMSVLLLEGERSPEMFGLIHEHLERCLPDVDRTAIPAASHDLKIQEPTAFNDIVLSFLN